MQINTLNNNDIENDASVVYHPESMVEAIRYGDLRLEELVFSPETGIAKTPIEGFLIVKRGYNVDERGSLQEHFRPEEVFAVLNEPLRPSLQSQTTYSIEGVLRGMHAGPEDKFIVPSIGRFLVAVVDVRKSSPTFKKSLTVEFDATNPTHEPVYGYFLRLGIANGFLVLDTHPLDRAKYEYSVTKTYNRETSRGFIYNDPEIGIEWPKGISPLVSEKDVAQPSFAEFIAGVDQKMYE